MAGMYDMKDLLRLLVEEDAEEVRLDSGMPPVMMLKGRSRFLDGAALTRDEIAGLFQSVATEEQRRELEQCGDIHFSFSAANSGRFGVSAASKGDSFNVRVRNLRH